MAAAENAAIVRRAIEEVYNKGNVAAIDELYDPGYVSHAQWRTPRLPPDAEGLSDFDQLKRLTPLGRAGFPDGQVTIDQVVADDDKVATCWTFRGTHQGDMWGLAPTGKQVTYMGFSIDRLAGGKIVESWYQYDRAGMWQQLGLIPETAEVFAQGGATS